MSKVFVTLKTVRGIQRLTPVPGTDPNPHLQITRAGKRRLVAGLASADPRAAVLMPNGELWSQETLAPVVAPVVKRSLDVTTYNLGGPIVIEENTPSTYSQWLQTDGSIFIPNARVRNLNGNGITVNTNRLTRIEGAVFDVRAPANANYAAVFSGWGGAKVEIKDYIAASRKVGAAGMAAPVHRPVWRRSLRARKRL